ncbi:MAG TPA: molybdenum cofactor carrier protein [Alphaproteobacteria bacterium]
MRWCRAEQRRARPVIAVMGSGIDGHGARAGPLGRWIAGQGFHLLTGGGGGVMASVAEAFAAAPGRAGLVIGVLPGQAGDAYPNPWVEIVIRTHLPLTGARGAEAGSRNHINVLSADVVVALPGGEGTASEVRLACAYRRPVVAHIADRGDIPGMPEQVPLAPGLDEVAAFVLAALDSAG